MRLAGSRLNAPNESYHSAPERQIFSWASSLLVAITGGAIALTFKGHRSLSPLQRSVLVVAIAVLGAHAII